MFGPQSTAIDNPSPQLSPVYQSEAAREIIEEMARNSNANRRTVPKEKRRHHTVSNIRLAIDPAERVVCFMSFQIIVFGFFACVIFLFKNSLVDLYEFAVIFQGTSRARDDLDMERALRPRINAPDVVRSTLSQRDLKYNESTIDTILGTPNKIVIPERFVIV